MRVERRYHFWRLLLRRSLSLGPALDRGQLDGQFQSPKGPVPLPWAASVHREGARLHYRPPSSHDHG